ncbi:CidA/LrgA family protein [Paraglaciecola sp. L3A3]|uniref:CidA/LrgA family protein n=1 Tax=Paraglaciecola sp. L3A3 TaxID=2686358 RepID=UPI00131D071F|nr:CidA/LrgA family protein [Paraglaciecola sp. L3A3]
MNIKKFVKGLTEYCVVAIVVALCLMAGRLIHQPLPLLPPSLYGMLLFAIVLTVGNNTGLLPEKVFHQPMAVILRFMSFVFIPVSVGVMQYGDLILSSGGKILLVGLSCTFFMIALVGFLSKKLLASRHYD